MSTVTVEKVRPGLFRYQTRLDVRHEGYETFEQRRTLANQIAYHNTPHGQTIPLDVRWAINHDFMPGFFMSLEWLGEEIPTNNAQEAPPS